MPLQVKSALQEAPGGKTCKPGGQYPEKIAAVLLFKQQLQRIACALRTHTEAAGSKERESADDKKDDATRRITDPHHQGE
jgi:hypothetical protein